MANLITNDALKSYPLPVTAKQWQLVGDDQLTTVIGFASDHIEDYLDRKVEITSVSDRIKAGSGTNRQLLSTYPVTELTSVKSYDGLNNETVHDLSAFYMNAESGILEFLERDKKAFTKSKIWVVAYDAGFATVPGPIQHAVALQTVKMLQPVFRGGSQFTETEFIMELDEQIVELLEYYKRRRIG